MIKFIDSYGIKKNMYMITDDGVVYSCTTGKPLSTCITKAGYKMVGLSTYTKRKLFYVHRLVASTFIPNPYKLDCVNHKNMDKLDNKVDNLEWCTKAYNNRHAATYTGLRKLFSVVKYTGWQKSDSKGSNNGMSKFTEKQVYNICYYVSKGYCYKDALRLSGLPVTTNNLYNVSHIIRGHRWKHISSKFNFQ